MIQFNSIQLDNLDAADKDVITAIMHKIKHILQNNVLPSTVAASCGICTQDMIAPMASLIHEILHSSNWQEVDGPVVSILSSYQFKLGDECKEAVIKVFKRCSEGVYPLSNFGDFIFDVWDMHQTDDTEATAGAQVVSDFIAKHSAT
jgi:hypothetical protein